MITFLSYLKAKSLEEAWKMNQKRSNRLIAGMGWSKMSHATLATALDLSGLALDQIEETEEEFIIGAMVTLRQFECHQGLNTYFHQAPKDSVRHIVGVQFRNCATMGGSVWLRAGFSDPLTLLLALDTSVELYQGEEKTTRIPLDDFCKMKKNNDLLVSIHIKKDGRKVVYESFRNTQTDFPVLTVAVSQISAGDGKENGENPNYCATVGARPSLCCKVEGQNPEALIKEAMELNYQDNIRATAGYRQHLSQVLIRRAYDRVCQLAACTEEEAANK